MIFKPSRGVVTNFCMLCVWFLYIQPPQFLYAWWFILWKHPQCQFTTESVYQMNYLTNECLAVFVSCGHSYTLVQWNPSSPFSVPISSWFSCDSSWSVESSTGTRYEAGAQPMIPDASAIHHPVWANTHKQYSLWQWMWVNNTLRNIQYITLICEVQSVPTMT